MMENEKKNLFMLAANLPKTKVVLCALSLEQSLRNVHSFTTLIIRLDVDLPNFAKLFFLSFSFRAKNGLAPMHLCAQEDRVNVAAILAARGADLDAETKAG